MSHLKITHTRVIFGGAVSIDVIVSLVSEMGNKILRHSVAVERMKTL